MKKQVAQFVPYTDALGKKVEDTTGMTPVNVGKDGKLYTEPSSPVIDDFYFTQNAAMVKIHTKDGRVLSDYSDPAFQEIITNRKYYGKYAKAVITADDINYYDAETLLQMVYTDGSVYCTWLGSFMLNDPKQFTEEFPNPAPFGITTGYNTASAFTVVCSNYSGV